MLLYVVTTAVLQRRGEGHAKSSKKLECHSMLADYTVHGVSSDKNENIFVASAS